MVTREIYKVDQNSGKGTYAGYAKFDSDGRYRGSRGGYGSRKNPKNVANNGRGNSDAGENPGNGGLRFQGNNSRNGASMLENAINTAGLRANARNNSRFRNTRR